MFNKDMELHQYSFKYGEDVIYRLCRISSVKSEVYAKGEYRPRIKYFEVDNPLSWHYVAAEEIDRAVATSGSTKIVVLSEPDYEKARKIVVENIRNRRESLLELVDKLDVEASRISSLELGEPIRSPWEEGEDL